MKKILPVSALLAATLLVLPIQAAPGAGGGMGGMMGRNSGNSAMITKLFGDTKAFSARVEFIVSDAAGAEQMSATQNFAFLDGKARTETDLTQIKSAQLQPQMMAQVRAMGMDKNVSLVRPQTKTVYLIYPGLKAYVEMPVPPADASAMDSKPKIEMKELGKETVDGQATVKNSVTITDDAGKKFEATVWNAPALKNFPLKIETKEGNNTVRIHYKEVKLAAPDAKLFEPPADYEKYGSQQELMQVVMQKMMSQGGGFPPPPPGK